MKRNKHYKIVNKLYIHGTLPLYKINWKYILLFKPYYHRLICSNRQKKMGSPHTGSDETIWNLIVQHIYFRLQLFMTNTHMEILRSKDIIIDLTSKKTNASIQDRFWNHWHLRQREFTFSPIKVLRKPLIISFKTYSQLQGHQRCSRGGHTRKKTID